MSASYLALDDDAYVGGMHIHIDERGVQMLGHIYLQTHISWLALLVPSAMTNSGYV